MYEISQLTQETAEILNKGQHYTIKRFNFMVMCEKIRALCITVRRLNAHFQTNRMFGILLCYKSGISSQLGYTVFLADGSDTSITVLYKPYKACRVVRSVSAVNLIAFSDNFYRAHTSAEEIRALCPESTVPVRI